MHAPAMTTVTQVACYITDTLISVADARRLILSDGGKPIPSTTQVIAHKDVLAFLTEKGEIQQLGNSFIAFV